MIINNISLLLRLILAHIISDFFIQSDALVKQKNNKNIKAHLLHAFIHAGCAYLFSGIYSNWIIPLTIFISHLLIDYGKTGLENKFNKHKLAFFIIDQIIHLLVIATLWICNSQSQIPFIQTINNILNSVQIWVIIVSWMLLLKPTSLLLALFTARWRIDSKGNDPSESLQNAGKWIGYLERSLIFLFILTGKIEAIGFLLAAKSIFRFGELNKREYVKNTEYILIGTLASFTLAISIGYLARNCLNTL